MYQADILSLGAHGVRLAAKILSGRKDLQIEEDFAACRDLCALQPMYRAHILSPVAHGVRLAAIRKSFPAERTYFDNHPRLPMITVFGGLAQKDTN
jgi:hypothetical protein